MPKAPDGAGTGYGSHQPALRTLAKFQKITSVIEFGAGLYSTHLFLDREAFPDLTSLTTFEHKKDWAKTVKVSDERHTLIIVPPEEFATRSRNMKADFVFLDCAPQSTRLSLVYHALILAPIFGIHDCDDTKKIDGFDAKYTKGFTKPILTAFASNTVDLSELELEE